jgi:hypothetical protein
MSFYEKDKPDRTSKLRKAIAPVEVVKAGGLRAYLKQVGLDNATAKIAGTLHLTDEEYEALQRDLERD